MFWVAVVVDVDDADVSDDTVAEAVVGLDGLAVVVEDVEVAGATAVRTCRVVVWVAVVVDVEVEEVTDDVVTDCARRGLVVVVEDETAVP